MIGEISCRSGFSRKIFHLKGTYRYHIVHVDVHPAAECHRKIILGKNIHFIGLGSQARISEKTLHKWRNLSFAYRNSRPKHYGIGANILNFPFHRTVNASKIRNQSEPLVSIEGNIGIPTIHVEIDQTGWRPKAVVVSART